MKGTRTIVSALLLALGTALVVLMLRAVQAPASPSAITVRVGGIAAGTVSALTTDPILGKRNAPVTLYLFSDFGCAPCAKTAAMLSALARNHPDTLRIVWKDLPLTEHPVSSVSAHVAARCAERQNKFWEFHNALFSSDEHLVETRLLSIAEQLNLDGMEFQKCMLSGEPVTEVDAGRNLALRLGITTAPHIFIGRESLSGLYTQEYLEELVARLEARLQ